MYRSLESIKNWQIYDFLKIFVIPGWNTPPHKIQLGDTSATLPNRNGRYQGTTCTYWINFYTPCKSQPISLPYYNFLYPDLSGVGVDWWDGSGCASDPRLVDHSRSVLSRRLLILWNMLQRVVLLVEQLSPCFIDRLEITQFVVNDDCQPSRSVGHLWSWECMHLLSCR